MMEHVTPTCDIPGAISVDEVGIEAARLAGHVLKSAYQPIFALSGGWLVPEAFEGFARPHAGRQPVAPVSFFASLACDERREAGPLCRLLHLRNAINLDAQRRLLFVKLTETASVEEVARLARHAGELVPPGGPEPELVFEIGHQADPQAGRALAEAARQAGAGVCFGGFGAGRDCLEAYRRLRPDIVRLDGTWFRQISASEPALRLLSLLVRGLRSEGARVLAAGIETPHHLSAALDAGVDLVQGFLLSRPAIVGTDAPVRPMALDALLASGGKIVPLFGDGRRPSIHQHR